METASGIVADLNGNVVSYGRGAEKIFGYMEEEVIGKSVAIFHPERNWGMLPRLFEQAMQGEFNEELTLVRKDGSEFSARLVVRPVKDENGKITGLIGLTKELS